MTGPVYLLFREFTQSARRSAQGAYASGLHHLLQSAVIGLNWTLDDATRIMREFAVLRGKYRFRLDERDYTTAIEWRNLSACRPFERLFERKPWVWPDRSISGRTAFESGQRFGIGSSIWLKRTEDARGGYWVVTSLHADRFTAVLYSNDASSTVYARKTFDREFVQLKTELTPVDADEVFEQSEADVLRRSVVVER